MSPQGASGGGRGPGWSRIAVILGLGLGLLAVGLARQRHPKEAAANPPRGCLSGVDTVGFFSRAGEVLSRVRPPLPAAPRARRGARRPPTPSAPHPPPTRARVRTLPARPPRRITYAFFVLSPQAADRALEAADPRGTSSSREVARRLLRILSRPGAADAYRIEVPGGMDPGPGVATALYEIGAGDILPTLDAEPVLLQPEDVVSQLTRLETALTKISNPERLAVWAAAWRVWLLRPQLANELGPLAPPTEGFTEAQRVATEKIHFEREERLIFALIDALKTAAERQPPAALFLIEVGH